MDFIDPNWTFESRSNLLPGLLKERESLNSNIVHSINQASDEWGIRCLRYEIKDIHVPPRVKESMQMQVGHCYHVLSPVWFQFICPFSCWTHVLDWAPVQVEAERKKRATVLESEGTREAAINVAEGCKQAQILASEGEKAEQINKATGGCLERPPGFCKPHLPPPPVSPHCWQVKEMKKVPVIHVVESVTWCPLSPH